MILHKCLEPADHTLVAAAIYSIDAFKTKLGMVDAVVSLKLEGTSELLQWQKFHKAINKRIVKRNELAHYQVLFNQMAPEKKRYALIPFLLDPHTERTDLLPIGLHLNELISRVTVFHLLCENMKCFSQRMNNRSISAACRGQFPSERTTLILTARRLDTGCQDSVAMPFPSVIAKPDRRPKSTLRELSRRNAATQGRTRRHAATIESLRTFVTTASRKGARRAVPCFHSSLCPSLSSA